MEGQGMNTLKDIVAAIDALPVEAFKNTYGHSHEVEQAVKRGYQRWANSREFEIFTRREEEAQEARRTRDTEVRRERAANVEKWLEDGTLVKGTFIKVTGARDGHGIREFISLQGHYLACRQWLPMRFSRHDKTIDPDKLRSQGCIKIADMWISPQAQMTTHEFNKVAKILS
jgi:hypothetical protein